MSETSQEFDQCAKLAQQAERYDDVAATVRKLAESAESDLSDEERGLLSAAFETVVNPRLKSFRILSSIEQKSQGNAKREEMAQEYRLKVQREIKEICGDVLRLLNEFLIPKAAAAGLESELFYLNMQHQYKGYLAEVAPGGAAAADKRFWGRNWNAKARDLLASLRWDADEEKEPDTAAAPIKNEGDDAAAKSAAQSTVGESRDRKPSGSRDRNERRVEERRGDGSHRDERRRDDEKSASHADRSTRSVTREEQSSRGKDEDKGGARGRHGNRKETEERARRQERR